MAARPTVVALGGGGFSMEPDNPLLDRHILSLARSEHPRVCFVPTASGDADTYVASFYRAFAHLDCHPSDLSLFCREVRNLEAFVLDQDVIYVGGGSTVNLLAVWRAHGLDRALRRAWEQGVILAGISAGMNCWFAGSVTDSFGPELAPLDDGLALISASCCPHYDGEPQRRPAYTRFVASAELPGGWAAEDGVALVFDGGELADIVSSRPDGAAYRVERRDREAHEERLAARYLGG